MNTAEDIKSFFKGDIDDSRTTLEKYSRDASLYKVRPSLVVFPKDSEDIKNLVSYIAKAKKEGNDLSLTARSAGTDMTGGPLSESIVVDFTKYINQLKTIGNDFAVVEPGMFYRDFEKAIAPKNLLLPSYPASKDLCAIGGMVANNAGGEKTLKYGKTEQYVEEIKMILHDGNEYTFKKLSETELELKKSQNDLEGEIYKKISSLIINNFELLKSAKPKVHKNSSGYYLWNVYNSDNKTFDITRLITGSQGTLGILTEIKLKLVHPKPASRLLVIFLKDLDPLADITERMLKRQPESFESYDNNTFRLAIKLLPELIQKIKGSVFKLILGMVPEIWIIATSGMPKLVLLAEFTADTTEEADRQAKEASEELKKAYPHLKTRVTKTDEETQEFWLIRRESFNLLRSHVRGLRTAPFIDDFSVRPEHLPEFLPKLYLILNSYKIIYTIAGHIGDGNFHIIPLMNFRDPKTKDLIRDLSKKVYGLVLEYGGSLSGEHNDGLIRSPYLKQQFGEEVYLLFEETKKIFDPDNVFNPGKKVGASLEYAMAHLDTENRK